MLRPLMIKSVRAKPVQWGKESPIPGRLRISMSGTHRPEPRALDTVCGEPVAPQPSQRHVDRHNRPLNLIGVNR